MSTTAVDSVHVANALLELASTQGVKPQFGNLGNAVETVDRLHLADTGKHAYHDHEHPGIRFKLATVSPGDRAKRYILRAGETDAMLAAPEPGDALDRAIRAAYRTHFGRWKRG